MLNRLLQAVPGFSVRVGECASVEAAADQFFECSAEHEAPLMRPVNYREMDQVFMKILPSIPVPRTFRAIIHGGRVLDEGVVLSKDGRLLREVCVANGYSPTEHPYANRRAVARTRKLRGRTAVAASRGGDCYYHWIFDVLPRLGLIEGEFRDALLIQNSVGYQQESLAMLGCNDVIPCGRGKHFACEELLLPSLSGTCGMPTPLSCNFLREKFVSEVKGTPDRLIYISREDSSNRRVSNESELLALLRPMGFEKHVLTGMNFASQVDLFASASVVVAPHGASLTNLVFCNPNTAVLELFHPAYFHWCYWFICACSGLRYAYGIPGGSPAIRHDPAHSKTPIYADIPSVEKLLTAFLDKQQ